MAAICRGLVEIGAQAGLHRVEEMPHNAVFVEAFDLAERRLNARTDLSFARRPLARASITPRAPRRALTIRDPGWSDRPEGRNLADPAPNH